jgi:serine/threonine-protein kinase
MHEITFKPGESCGNYRILSLIGIGGVAEVYKAAHRSTNVIAAIKVLRRFFADNLYLKEHMLSEAKLLSEVRHENVVRVDDLGIEEGTLWMAMEHLAGATLRTLLQHGRPLPLQMALHFARGIAAGAGATHAAGSLHRGLTPENIMIVGRNKVKVLDRSAAKLYGWDAKRTTKGVLFGSPLYMSPEHVRDDVLEPRSDVYSLGIILYEMIAGRHPFVSGKRDVLSKHQICEMHVEVEPAPLIERVPGIPLELSILVQRAVAKDRNARPRSMLEFEHALRSFMGPVVLDAPPVPSLRRISSRSPMSVALPPPREPQADDDDRPTLVYRRDHDAPPSSSAPLLVPARQRSSVEVNLDELNSPPDSTSAVLALSTVEPIPPTERSAARHNSPPPLPVITRLNTPHVLPAITRFNTPPPVVEVRPRAVREPVPSLPGLSAAAHARSSGPISPFDLAYEAATASARRKLRRTSIALRVSAGVATMVGVLALTYARLSAAPGGVAPLMKTLGSPFETTPEAVTATVDNALAQPAPASRTAPIPPEGPPETSPPAPQSEKPADLKATPVCRPGVTASTPPPPPRAKPAPSSSDPYEDVLLRPNPYDDDDVYGDKPAPSPKPAPRKNVNPYSPHGI